LKFARGGAGAAPPVDTRAPSLPLPLGRNNGQADTRASSFPLPLGRGNGPADGQVHLQVDFLNLPPGAKVTSSTNGLNPPDITLKRNYSFAH
jgi:hypothetical protein